MLDGSKKKNIWQILFKVGLIVVLMVSVFCMAGCGKTDIVGFYLSKQGTYVNTSDSFFRNGQIYFNMIQIDGSRQLFFDSVYPEVITCYKIKEIQEVDDDRFLLTLEYASGGKIVGKNNIKPIEEAKIGQISSREICFASDSMLYYPEHPEKRFMFISGGMNLEKAVETATRYCKRKL